MNGGPYSNLPTRKAWKRLAESADNPAAGAEELIQTFRYAPESDLREKMPNQLLRRLQVLLGDRRCGFRFIGAFENSSSDKAAGFRLSMAFVDNVIRISNDKLTMETLRRPCEEWNDVVGCLAFFADR